MEHQETEGQTQAQQYSAHANEVSKDEVMVREHDAFGEQPDESPRDGQHHERERQRCLRLKH